MDSRTCKQCGKSTLIRNKRYSNTEDYLCIDCIKSNAAAKRLKCIICGNIHPSTTPRKSQKEYVCLACKYKSTQVTIPPGSPYRCLTCRLEYMRKDGGSTMCPLCEAKLRHNLSKISI